MQLDVTRVRGLAPLAWLVVGQRSSSRLRCYVGAGVEATDEWLVEGVWDGAFDAADFDRTDLVFGSGVRVRGQSVVLVSAGSTVDRLQSTSWEDGFCASNSLPLLLAFVDGSLDPSFLEYRPLFRSIKEGLSSYVAELPSTAGSVRLTYFENLVWDGDVLRKVSKPDPGRDLGSFSSYRGFLDGAMSAITRNGSAAGRAQSFGLMSTLSAGYDSPAVSVLAKGAGCREAFGFDVGRDGEDDSGEDLARHLGFEFHAVRTEAAPERSDAPLLFLAACVSGGADVPFSAAAPYVEGKILFTGFHGDKMWAKNPKAFGPDLVRSDNSGADLTEYRLWKRFVNCAVPFWGARQIADIVSISRSEELRPWDVEGWYSRPIPRRIVEQAGAPRDSFGVHKRAIAGTVRAWSHLPAELRADYRAWSSSKAGTSANDGSPETDARDPFRFLLHWSVDHVKDRYAKALRASTEADVPPGVPSHERA